MSEILEKIDILCKEIETEKQKIFDEQKKLEEKGRSWRNGWT